LGCAAATRSIGIRRADTSRGTIHIVRDKHGADLHIPIHPASARAIEAGPRNGLQLIGDQNGRPISRTGGDTAGLPAVCVPHGLRKAALRRLAEHGSSSKQIAAVSGHASLSEIERYTKGRSNATGACGDPPVAKYALANRENNPNDSMGKS
jgi:integrase